MEKIIEVHASNVQRQNEELLKTLSVGLPVMHRKSRGYKTES